MLITFLVVRWEEEGKGKKRHSKSFPSAEVCNSIVSVSGIRKGDEKRREERLIDCGVSKLLGIRHLGGQTR